MKKLINLNLENESAQIVYNRYRNLKHSFDSFKRRQPFLVKLLPRCIFQIFITSNFPPGACLNDMLIGSGFFIVLVLHESSTFSITKKQSVKHYSGQAFVEWKDIMLCVLEDSPVFFFLGGGGIQQDFSFQYFSVSCSPQYNMILQGTLY